ncbi:MAG: two-component system sensor histidine kinase [Paenibacillaceae bacterium]|jgi:signal transduction histidine kinase|nr:two-component system sensor histidine kinase [Paenibacillaceae bacterium]
MKAKWRKSLLVRYLMIITLALLMFPLVFPASAVLYSLPHELYGLLNGNGSGEPNPYESRRELTEMWHHEALELDGADPAAISARMGVLKERFPKADMFWVGAGGDLMLALPGQEGLPAHWTAADSIAFMKQSYDANPFTVVAFIGEKRQQGFMVLQVPHVVIAGGEPVIGGRYFMVVLGLVFVLFLMVSGFFFYRIRRRLVRLEQAMSSPDPRGIPRPVNVRQEDEIGQLEHAFNRMIGELDTSRSREQEEERLRKQLIASLSHDLRTPLTIIRSHAYSLRQDVLSGKGQQSLALIEAKSDDLNRLIDNLLSFTLLSAGKYPLVREQADMARLMRTAAAGWYPLFEAEGFEVEVVLPEYPVYWQIDPRWMIRILDNLLQNCLRHAKQGCYVAILLEEGPEGSTAVIEDKGPGITAVSGERGAGIGLEIVALMTRELGIGYRVESGSGKTRVCMSYRASVPVSDAGAALDEI